MKDQRLSSNKHPSALLGLCFALLGAACQPPDAARDDGQEPAPEPASASQAVVPGFGIDIDRSLAIVDLPTLGTLDPTGKERFSLKRVLQYIASTSGSTQQLSALELYRRLWDTNNSKATGFVPGGQHCDDQRDSHGNAVLNGFPIQCPRQEGILADVQNHNPFCSGDEKCEPYSPIAIVNRFDLAPANGKNCGQYRMVFGKGTTHKTPVELAGNPDPFDRNLIIFEAILPNPHPGQGLAACKPAVAYWAALSAEPSRVKRAAALDKFFFQGIPGFEAAFDFSHFTGAVDQATQTQMSGQIRANQFMFNTGAQPWQLREYNLEKRCTGSGRHRSCSGWVKMVTTKLNPEASLFDDANQSPRALAFRDPYSPNGFFSQIEALATPDLNLLNMNGLNPVFNGGQSTSSPVFAAPGAPPPPPSDDTNYLIKFKPSGPFGQKIQHRLVQMGSKLGALHIVRRAQTQSCAGCHELSTSTASFFGGKNESNKVGDDLLWPDAALGAIPLAAFTQTSEALLLPLSPEVTCDAACTADTKTCQCAWALSQALREVFLPFRRDNVAAFLSYVYTGESYWDEGGWGPAHERVKGSPDN